MNDKIRVTFMPMKNEVVKLGGMKITIKPYLDFEDILLANKMCLDEFFRNANEEGSQFELFPAVKLAFDSVVLNQCTNINFDGMVWDDIIRADIMSKIRSYVYNYDEAYAQILESLRLKNVYTGLSLIANTLPKAENIKESIESASRLISQMNKDDPQTLGKLVKTVALSNGIEKIKTEEKLKVQETKEEQRQEKLDEIVSKFEKNKKKK